MTDSMQRLSDLFEKFPGIGPRQAQRFVQYLLRTSPALRRDIADGIRDLSSSVFQCPECMRYSTGEKGQCSICSDTHRDRGLLAVVASDADLLALERSHMFRGTYFVLGGLISLASDKMNGLRVRELISLAQKRATSNLQEIILALPANPEGDSTAIRVREELAPLAVQHSFKISMLGRGLSTGSELEYADPETLKNAFDNRR